MLQVRQYKVSMEGRKEAVVEKAAEATVVAAVTVVEEVKEVAAATEVEEVKVVAAATEVADASEQLIGRLLETLPSSVD